MTRRELLSVLLGTGALSHAAIAGAAQKEAKPKLETVTLAIHGMT